MDDFSVSPGTGQTPNASVTQIRIRHAVDARVLAVSRHHTFRDVIYHFNMLCSSSQSVDPEECVISPQMGSVYFNWDDKVSTFLDIAWVFREQPYSEVSYEENIETLLVMKKSEIGDALRRVSLEIDPTMIALYTGFLFKKGSGSLSSFKRRWFVLQNATLYYMDEPSSPQASGCIPMGGVELKLRPDLTYKDKICFELTAEHLGLRNFVMAGDQAEIDMLQTAMDLHQLRRVRTICVDAIEVRLFFCALPCFHSFHVVVTYVSFFFYLIVVYLHVSMQSYSNSSYPTGAHSQRCVPHAGYLPRLWRQISRRFSPSAARRGPTTLSHSCPR